jgi:hypothetical protein
MTNWGAHARPVVPRRLANLQIVIWDLSSVIVLLFVGAGYIFDYRGGGRRDRLS